MAVFGCSTTEPRHFETELTELCEDHGYMWKSTIERDYYIPTYNTEPDRDFEEELGELAIDFGYAPATYVKEFYDYMVVVK